MKLVISDAKELSQYFVLDNDRAASKARPAGGPEAVLGLGADDGLDSDEKNDADDIGDLSQLSQMTPGGSQGTSNRLGKHDVLINVLHVTLP